MNDKSIEEMKAELVVAEYMPSWSDKDIDNQSVSSVRSPVSTHWIEFLGRTRREAISNAYAHLQGRKELEALRAENKELRAFVLESGSDWLDVYDPNIGEYVSAEADKLIDKYNITAEEGDTDE